MIGWLVGEPASAFLGFYLYPTSTHAEWLSTCPYFLYMFPARRNAQLLFLRRCAGVTGVGTVTPTSQASICPGLPLVHLPCEVWAAWQMKQPASRKLRMRHGWTQSGLDCALSYCLLYSKAGFVWASLYRVWRSQTAHDSFHSRSLPCVCVFIHSRECVWRWMLAPVCECGQACVTVCFQRLERGQPWMLGPQFLHCLWVFFSLPLHKAG